MHPETKKLGEMLVEAGLITPGQLQEALRHQRIAGGRTGSTLVAMGFLNEASLMDFLAQQTGVPRMDLKNLEVPIGVLEKIPRRLAEQMSILPIAFKEPKSLVVAMADPMDLNAVDSARFASGLNIEPVVASHTALKHAIAEQYRKLEGSSRPQTFEVGGQILTVGESLVVPFEIAPSNDPRATVPPGNMPWDPSHPTPKPAAAAPANPFSFFPDPTPAPPPSEQLAPQGQIVFARSAKAEVVRPVENYGTRALVMGLIKLLQRRGILGEDELQRLLVTLVDTREIDPNE
jgi:hypothetical protein